MLRGPEEQVEHHLPVDRGRDLTPRDGAVQHDPVLAAQRLEHPLPPRGAQRRVVLRLGDQPGQHRPHRGLGDRPDPQGQRGDHVTAQRPGVRQRLLGLERGHERVQCQQALGRPAPVDRRLAHPGPRRDLLDGDSGQPPGRQQVRGGGQDRAVRLLRPRPPPLPPAPLGRQRLGRQRLGGQRFGGQRLIPRNIPVHLPVLPSRNPKRSVPYLIGIMPGTASPQTPPAPSAPPSAPPQAPPSAPPSASPQTPPRTRRPLQLALILVAAFMVVLDFSIVNVALPSIARELHMPADAVQWIVTGYAISFGGLLILGGRAADLFGRRRMFVAGLIAFSVASLAGGLAQDSVLLIAARVVQGAGAAIVAPAALSLITTGFPEGAERTRAIGLYGAVSSVGFVAGQVLGGVLVQLTSWRAVFLVNVPVGLIALLVTPRLLAESRGPGRHGRRLDIGGAVLITGAVAALVFAVS